MEQVYTPKQNNKVLVRCFTYNQSKYIEDALNGFAMQKTDFPFVCLVMDDASTDGEQEVIKAWMERECDMARAEYVEIELSNIVLVPHKSNSTCTFAFYFLKENLYRTRDKKMSMIAPWREHCEYEALCEGDDYWIDSTKLQCQISFLDENLDYGMVFSRSLYLKNDGYSRIYGSGYGSLREILLIGNTVPTATVCYRIEYAVMYAKCEPINKEKKEKQWKLGDYPLWVFIGSKSKIKFLTEVTSAYRCLSESSSHSNDVNKQIAFLKSSKEVVDFLINFYFPEDTLLKKQANRRYAWGIFRKYMMFNMSNEAYAFLSNYYGDLTFRMKVVSIIMKIGLIKNIILHIWKKQ